jgi:hypothetical protein
VQVIGGALFSVICIYNFSRTMAYRIRAIDMSTLYICAHKPAQKSHELSAAGEQTAKKQAYLALPESNNFQK